MAKKVICPECNELLYEITFFDYNFGEKTPVEAPEPVLSIKCAFCGEHINFLINH